jgi:hypothetical protein
MTEKDFINAIRHAIDGDLLEKINQNGVYGLRPKARKTN